MYIQNMHILKYRIGQVSCVALLIYVDLRVFIYIVMPYKV